MPAVTDGISTLPALRANERSIRSSATKICPRSLFAWTYVLMAESNFMPGLPGRS